MTERKYHLHDGKKGAALALRIIPRASENKVDEILKDGTLQVRLSAPPIESEINETLTHFLSEVLDIPKSRIEIIAGQKGREKLVSVLDMDADIVHQKMLSHISK